MLRFAETPPYILSVSDDVIKWKERRNNSIKEYIKTNLKTYKWKTFF